eukprot:12912097-Prorocentrum_lima.AAC.1
MTRSEMQLPPAVAQPASSSEAAPRQSAGNAAAHTDQLQGRQPVPDNLLTSPDVQYLRPLDT